MSDQKHTPGDWQLVSGGNPPEFQGLLSIWSGSKPIAYLATGHPDMTHEEITANGALLHSAPTQAARIEKLGEANEGLEGRCEEVSISYMVLEDKYNTLYAQVERLRGHLGSALAMYAEPGESSDDTYKRLTKLYHDETAHSRVEYNEWWQSKIRAARAETGKDGE